MPAQLKSRHTHAQLITRALQQLQILRFWLLSLGAITLALLIALSAASESTGIPVGTFTRDPAAVLQGHFYVGILSNIGIVLWSASATICLFSALLLGMKIGRRAICLFLLTSGLITSLVMLDDLFLFHEDIAPHFLHMRERYVLIAYALMILAYLAKFRTTILETDFVPFAIALGFFFLSVFIDKNSFDWLPDPYLLEDGAKFAGIVFWLFYFSRTAYQGLAVTCGILAENESPEQWKDASLPGQAPEA
ncbi:hypothetical protein [Microbulbifer zhoushanensis]|uniref:hypothetical protein n=1 Tax=Microbulbifer zhoushanensis TaxID=2904254 RepID=UPI001F243EBF|nr:hypothetical protein [Microbulbifer zhoushanensis]